MKEFWKKIEGYEKYSVSTKGRVRNDKTGTFLTVRKEKNGYCRIRLFQDKKTIAFYLHRLVGKAFLLNDDSDHKTCINHKDENVENNSVVNLEWCTYSYNINYGHRNEKVSKTMKNNPGVSKKVICLETGEIFPSASDASRKLGCCPTAVTSCINKNCRCKRFTFKYI